MFESKIKYIKNLLVTKQASCEEITKKYLSSIQELNGDINAYINVTEDVAIKTAKKVDEKLSRGEELAPLEGIPMTLKDNISTKGIKTTCCSNMLREYIPPYDATVWKTLKEQNAILLGKTNMDEFAMGCSCGTSCFGGSKNPYDVTKVPGGSSGGAAAAVAANLAVYALGSDTGGSIRQPSSFCGIVGMKPTYGTLSRYGLIAFASSLDQIGPMASNVEDTAIIYDALSTKDSMDSTSSVRGVNTCAHELNKSIKGLKVGLPKQYFEGLNDDVRIAVERAINIYKSLGAEMVELDMPNIKYSLPIYYILACAEGSSNIARFDGVRYGYRSSGYKNMDDLISKTRGKGFGAEVKRRMLLGTYVLSDGQFEKYYKDALKIRCMIIESFKEAFKKCDVILSSTVPSTAFAHDFVPEDQMDAYMTDICTVPVNMAGISAVSIPCGMDTNGMPIGMQIIGNSFCDARVLNVAYQFERTMSKETFRTLNLGVKL